MCIIYIDLIKRTSAHEKEIKMKKLLALVLTVVLAFSLVACFNQVDPNAKSEGVMTYDEYVAAEVGSQVVIEAFVQAKQGWWNDQLTLYLQDGNGGYFSYNTTCSESLAESLVIGTKVKISGEKAVWSGEVEIMNGTVEISGTDTWIAPVLDATALLGTDDLIKHQNEKVSFKGMTVVASEGGAAFLYNWDGSGSADSDSDLYFNVSINGETYTFVIEYYLTGPDSDAYKAVQALNVGDVIDVEGFLYWYNDAQPHITSVTVK